MARLVAPNSPSPKEAAFAGLLVAIAGFFSFSQNLVVDGFGEAWCFPLILFHQTELAEGITKKVQLILHDNTISDIAHSPIASTA